MVKFYVKTNFKRELLNFNPGFLYAKITHKQKFNRLTIMCLL